MAEHWNLTGTYFETCNCEAACPCVFLSPPSTGECTVLVAWHIDQGRSDDAALDGLNPLQGAIPRSLLRSAQTPFPSDTS